MKVEAEFDPMSEGQAWKTLQRFMNSYLKNPKKHERKLIKGLRSISMDWSVDIPDPDICNDRWP